MSNEGLLLGFDARPPKPREWEESRKRRCLFRLDVAPLSIDPMVWPSVFEANGIETPAWTGRFGGLWEDLATLRDFVAAEREGLGDVCLVAFDRTLAGSSPAARLALETLIRGIYPYGTPGELPDAIADPAAVEPGWTFLGYDVSDLWGLSGLMNAGFLPDREDVDALRDRWGPKLNSAHLFNALDDARAFRDYADGHIPEHAPFYVDGLWLIEGSLHPA
ncbi:MAG: hypothetical protein ACJ75H_13455 [Thermoanaerobaculia bacterium]